MLDKVEHGYRAHATAACMAGGKFRILGELLALSIWMSGPALIFDLKLLFGSSFLFLNWFF